MSFMGAKEKCYWWFDTPDGEDIVKKTNFAVKLGFMAGFPMGLFDITSQPQPTLASQLFRTVRITVPVMGAGAMFALTSQLLCREFPNLDKKIAYGLGGVSVGAVVQASAKNKYIGSITAFYGFFFGYFGRDFYDLPDIPLYGLPQSPVTDNDWELYRYSSRQDPGLNLPPPYARPARPGSQLF